jgi:hypothetical protein
MPHSHLGLARPAARTRIFARFDRLRAGKTADRQIAVGDERVFAQVVRAHVGGEVGVVQRASGLMRMRGPTASKTGKAARVAAWKRLRPVNHAPNGSTPRAMGSTLRTAQQASVSVRCRRPFGSARSSAASSGVTMRMSVRPRSATSASR